MKHRWVVFLSVVVANIVLVKFFWEGHPEIVMMIAPAIFGLVPLINKWIKERQPPRLLTVQEFGLQWPVLFLYGIVMIFVSLQFIGFIAVFVSGLLANSREQLIIAIGILSFVVFLFWGYPLFFISGRWMGRRSMLRLSIYKGMFGVLVTSILAVLVSVVLGLITIWYLPNHPLQSLPSVPFFEYAFFLVLILLPSLYGYWRGRRQIVGAYMGYLLNKTPDDIRNSIFDLAYEEVVRLQRETKETQGTDDSLRD